MADLPILCALGVAFLVRTRGEQRNPFGCIPRVFAGVAIACVALRLGTAAAFPTFAPRQHYTPTHLRIDSLMCGVALAYVHAFFPDRIGRLARWRAPLAIGGCLMFLPAFFADLEATPFIYTLGFTLFYIGAAMLVLAAVAARGW